jgi:hypothetical protein
MKKTLDSTVKNLLRSGQLYFRMRTKLIGEFLKSPGERLELNSTYLLASAFRLKKGREFLALRFSDEDWDNLKKLGRVASGSVVEANMLRLAASYILANVSRIAELQNLDATASSMILEGKNASVETEILKLDKIERQSLFVFKLVAAVNFHSHDHVAKYFSRNPHSAWVRERFSYPLIFFTINRLDAASLGDVLLSIFPWLEKYSEERRVLRYLLRSDFEHGDSLSSKCYAALMSHPFDALRMITDHLEGKFSAGAALTVDERDALALLADVFPGSPVGALREVVSGRPLRWLAEGDALALDFELTSADRVFLKSFFDLSHHALLEHPTKLLSALGRMRWRRYPELADFEMVVSVTSQFAFLSVGRLLDAALMSLYMVTRRTKSDERRFLIRCVHLFDGFTPFLITSPRASSALTSGFLKLDSSISQIDGDTAAIVRSTDDRTWMKNFHWDVRSDEQRLRLNDYFSAVRREMRPSVNLRFLSGIDWRWVVEVMEALKIAPFRTSDAIYALFLRVIEERDAQPNYVRIALRPTTSGMTSVMDFVRYLVAEYGRDAFAIIRVALTPDMILKMQLESYYAAALAERLDALTKCVEEFGFDDDILTEEQFLTEQRTLTTALMLMNVHSAQFAVSWEEIRNTAVQNAKDIFTAFEAVNRTFDEIPLLSDALRQSPLTFANRQTVVYTLKNRLWPAAAIVERVIDAFLSHPSHGIESILAVRIRHDNLRYEFGLVVESVKSSRISGVHEPDKQFLVPLFDAAVTEAVNRWVDRYMHTAPTPERKAIFEFVPNDKQLGEFISEVGGDNTLESIVDKVIAWLQSRLRFHLEVAKELLEGELRDDIHRVVNDVEAGLLSNCQVSDDRIVKVRKALLTALDSRCDQLREWFESPINVNREDVAVEDIKLAVDGRFRSEIEGGKLKIDLQFVANTIGRVKADSVRLVFDIWSEIARNAMKYSGLPKARLRVSSFRTDEIGGLVFSSRRDDENELWVKSFEGEPKNATSSAIFKSGRSGLPKVAHLAASVAGNAVTVRVHRRKRGFHVFVPLEVLRT